MCIYVGALVIIGSGTSLVRAITSVNVDVLSNDPQE